MFVNENYERYKYLVEASDNYVVLSRQSSVSGSWDNPNTINVIYQYIIPSTLTLEGTKTFTSSQSFTEIDISSNYWDRGDIPIILLASFSMLFFLLFLFNGLTRIARKGGIFFGN